MPCRSPACAPCWWRSPWPRSKAPALSAWTCCCAASRMWRLPSLSTESMAETIRDLLSYRIHRLAGALSRGAALRYRREFGVSLVEWRTIALLGGHAPLALKDLARQAGLDKSLVSRTVSALAARGLVL